MKFVRRLTHSHGWAHNIDGDVSVVDDVVEAWSSICSMSIYISSGSGSMIVWRFVGVVADDAEGDEELRVRLDDGILALSRGDPD